MHRARPVAALVCVLFVAGSLVLWFGRPHPAIAAPEDGEDSASPAATFEVYKDKSNEFRWRLRARNTHVIATSGQGYSDKRSCTDAIESVKRDAPKALVKEVENGQ